MDDRLRDRLTEVFIQQQGPAHIPRDLRHFHRVRQARAQAVVLVADKDLGLVKQLAEGAAVDDAVPVALVRRAFTAVETGFLVRTAACLVGLDGVCGEAVHGELTPICGVLT